MACTQLRELRTTLAKPLYAIFTESMNTGKLPKDWKMGHVSLIYKKGSRNQAKNNRPVSLTSVVCKTMELMIRDKFMDHLINHELLTCQYGFMKGCSCVTQLLADIDCIYLDFSKAFDSVPHQHLLMKLRKFGISQKILSCMCAFLLRREPTNCCSRSPIHECLYKVCLDKHWSCFKYSQLAVHDNFNFAKPVNDRPETDKGY